MNTRLIDRQTQNDQFSYRLLFVYFFLEYGRPQDYVGALGSLKPGLIVTLLLFFAWIAKGDKAELKRKPLIYMMWFIGLSALSVSYAINNFHAYQATKLLTIYLIGGILPIIWLLNSYERFISFVRFWMLLHVFVAVMSILNGGKGPGSFLEDENDLALTLNMVLPYLWFMFQSQGTTGAKRFYYLIAACIVVAAIVATASRGGFLGLIAVIFGIILFSKNRIRNCALIIFLGLGAFLLIPDSYKKEIQSISDTQDSTRNDRLHSWEMGWDMFLDNPILGVGTNNYPWNVHIYEMHSKDFDSGSMRMHGGRAAHSLYFTLIPELGLAGTIVYMCLIYLMCKKLFHIMKFEKSAAENSSQMMGDYALIARAMLISIMTFLITGAFISVLYYPHLWYMVGIVTVLFNLSLHLDSGAVKKEKQINVK